MKDTPVPPGAPPLPEGMLGTKTAAADAGSDSPPRFRENLQMLWRFRGHFLPYLFPAIGLLVLALIQADLALTATVAAQRVIDLLAAGGAAGGAEGGALLSLSEPLFRLFAAGAGVLTLAALMAAFLVVSQGLGIGIEQIRAVVSERFRQRMQTHLVGALARETGATRGQRSTGKTTQIFGQDASGLSGLLIFGLVSVLEDVVKLGVYAFGLWRIEGGWVIVAIVFPAIVLFQGGIARFFLPRETKLTERSEEFSVEVSSRSVEFFENLSKLVYFKGERQEGEKLLGATRQSGEANRRYQLLTSVHMMIAGLTITLSLPLVILAMQAVAQPTAGTIIQAQTLITLLLTTLGGIIAFPSMLAQFSPSMRRIEEILDIPEPGEQPAALPALRDRTGPMRLEIQRLSFAYDETTGPVLHDIDLVIPAGACVGIVGRSGCGKSTLARLLLGDRHPTSGSILMDGEDVTEWHLHWRRELVGFMPAEPGFLRGTLLENVHFGRPSEEIHDLDRALDASGVRAIIEQPRIREGGGVKFLIDGKVEDILSTGERKRVGLARVLSHDKRLWIFDEPGSGLDPQRMGEIARALRTAVEGRTSIIITHDPDVFLTDFIVFLEEGRIRAVGPHHELLRTDPLYRKVIERHVHEREVGPEAGEENGERPAPPSGDGAGAPKKHAMPAAPPSA